ncbi:MAG: hypothetical protein IT204_08535 [Fimbriimonadaceae bacterium]|nr:hypothetical protein [Fimbriimonadaceae bacterium]
MKKLWIALTFGMGLWTTAATAETCLCCWDGGRQQNVDDQWWCRQVEDDCNGWLPFDNNWWYKRSVRLCECEDATVCYECGDWYPAEWFESQCCMTALTEPNCQL